MKELEATWYSLTDYILHTQFNKPWKMNCACKKYVEDNDIVGQVRFSLNEFPYDIKTGFHYILWCGPPATPYDDSAIISEECVNRLINEHLSVMMKERDAYDFAWYENPKMTIPDIYHVQVFWTKLK